MNVVFWTGIKNDSLSTKYGGFDWMDYSKQSWQYWCDKHNVKLVVFDQPYSDISLHRANWQKAIHCWDILDDRGVNPDNEVEVPAIFSGRLSEASITNLVLPICNPPKANPPKLLTSSAGDANVKVGKQQSIKVTSGPILAELSDIV